MNPPSDTPQADDGARMARLQARNRQRMQQWHDRHHSTAPDGTPIHVCAFASRRCHICDEEGRP